VIAVQVAGASYIVGDVSLLLALIKFVAHLMPGKDCGLR